MRWSRLKARIEEARTEGNNDSNSDVTNSKAVVPTNESQPATPVKKKRTLKRKRGAGDKDGARDGDAGAATAN